MRCPYCFYEETDVIDSRAKEDVVRRRRECAKCKKRFTTYEKVEMVELIIIKKDGRREPFNRQKIFNGIVKACEKRPISMETIENIVDEIERELRNMDSIEIKSSIIGEMVMDRLKKLDKVAYIRFASVYRSFTDISSFEDELKSLK